MNIAITTPEITLLRARVEQKAGIRPVLPGHFMLLAETVSEAGERLSQTTIERVWQYSTRGASHVALHTLNVLARYVGAADWHDFCADIAAAGGVESASFKTCGIDAGALAEGTRLRLSWLPNRTIEVVSRGGGCFCVERSENSSLQAGDTFECINIQEGQPLYLDRFRRGGAADAAAGRYVVGRNSGLTSAEIIG